MGLTKKNKRELDTTLFDKAAMFALKAHSGTERRGKGTPYALHLFEAASIVASITTDPELIAAAILHDTIEDTGVTKKEIEKRFGKRVADLVDSESQPEFPGLSHSEAWLPSKEWAIKKLTNASKDAKIVAIGDKLSNARAIAKDFYIQGDKLWKKFHAPRPQMIEWYYRSLVTALSELSDTDAYKEFSYLVNKTFSDAFKNLD